MIGVGGLYFYSPQTAQGGRGKQFNIRSIGAHDVPNVAANGHLRIHESLILEVQYTVRNGNFSVGRGTLGVPVDAGDGPLDIGWIAEHGQTLCTWGLRAVISLDTLKVLLVDVNRVVLFHALPNQRPQALHGALVVIIFLRLLPESGNVRLLGEVNILGPATLLVPH